MIQAGDASQKTAEARVKGNEKTKPYLDHIEKKIILASEAGRYHIEYSFPIDMDDYQKEIIQNILVVNGYTVSIEPAEDRPAGRAGYLSIHWE